MTGEIEFDEGVARQLDAMYRMRDAVRRRELARAALGAQPGDRVLDVGCGPGFYVRELLDEVGPEGAVTGIDSSPQMLAVAAERCSAQPNAEFAEGEATRLPVEDGAFDRALSVQVLEYVPDVPAALAELRRALRPGGRLLIWDVDWATTSMAGDQEANRRMLSAWDEHLVHPSLPRALSAQLREAGFEDVVMAGHAFTTNSLDPEAYGGGLVDFIAGYVMTQDAGVPPEEAEAWRTEQHRLHGRGEFYFACIQFCFTAAARG